MAGLLQDRLAEEATEERKEQKSRTLPDNKRRQDKEKNIIQKRREQKETGVNKKVVSKAIDNFAKPEEKEDIDYSKTVITDEDREELRALEELASEENYEKSQRKSVLIKRISMIALSFVCVYLIMLIYGTFVTEYRYNQGGEIEPVIMSVSEIADRNEYTEMLGYYMEARNLYEEILTLDYRVSQQTEDLIPIATEYEGMIENIDALVVQIEASSISTKYNQILSLLHTIVNNHMVSYCTYMSMAITQNDSNAQEEALAARTVLESTFKQVTENIISLGETVKGYDITDIKEWSPDGYIQGTILGLGQD